ncbi:hypothetical protein [Burkholderia ubonensis]|uniref:hypothetical protein n=2 Tax=Burkholderia ubonensis TaxID=101571 RepID=UPI0015A52C87|nr:hypothetical protein [Burkholderia ubonensis]
MRERGTGMNDAGALAYASAIALLCALHASTFVMSLRLPLWSDAAGRQAAGRAPAESR